MPPKEEVSIAARSCLFYSSSSKEQNELNWCCCSSNIRASCLCCWEVWLEYDLNLLRLVFQRFFPSEYGLDADRVTLLPPVQNAIGIKSRVRRAIEQAGIPFTIATNTAFASIFLDHFWHWDYETLPRDKVEFFGDGEGRGTCRSGID